MIDQEMLEEFIIEAEEHLTEMEECLLRLEGEPDNEELLNDIFRAAHSLKGTAGLTGLIKINEVAHKMENLLEYLRQGKLKVNTTIATALFEGMDAINGLVKGLSETGEESHDINTVVERLEKIIIGEDVDEQQDRGPDESGGTGGPEWVGESAETTDSGDTDEIISQAEEEQRAESFEGTESGEEETVDLLALEDESSAFEEEFDDREETFGEEPIAAAHESIDETQESEIDGLEQLFIEQSKEKIEALTILINNLKTEGTTDDTIQKGRDEIEDFQNVVELSTHDDILNPLRNMDEILNNIYGTGQSLESEQLGILEQDMESIREKLSVPSGEPTTQHSDAEPVIVEGQETKKTVSKDLLSIIDELRSIKGLGPSKIQALCDAGLTEQKDFTCITKSEILKVRGITKKLAQDIIEKLKSLSIEESPAPVTFQAPEMAGEETSPIFQAPEQPVEEDISPLSLDIEPSVEEEISPSEPLVQNQEIDSLCFSLEDAIINDEYDSELIEIFLNHVRKGYEELVSDFSLSQPEQTDTQQADHALEVVTGLRKASNYMDFPDITEFLSQWIKDINETKDKIVQGQNYDLNIIKDNAARLKVFLPHDYAEKIILEEPVKTVPPVKAEVITEKKESVEEQKRDAEKILVSQTTEVQEIQQLPQALDTSEEQEPLEKPLRAEMQGEIAVQAAEACDVQNKEEEMIVPSDVEAEMTATPEQKDEKSTYEKDIADEADIKNDLADNDMHTSDHETVNQAIEEEQQELADFEPEEVESKASIKEDSSQSAEVKQTLRVDTQKVDALMNQVGELVVNRALFSQLSEEIKIKIKALLEIDGYDKKELKDLILLNFRLGEATLSLGRVANDLQESVMKIRMLPISKLFNRYPRLVRELALELSKKVELSIQGENTELDKRVIEQMADPLIHIIRNAIDHGIEIPQERKKKGKPETGILILSSYYEGNHVVIKIDDDGNGINSERIKEKALSMGVISKTEAERLTEKDALNLIFLPGMSTALEVTRTSGRGVGMDVVKKNVEKLNGTIELMSEPGIGTSFIIKIPLTLAIIQVLLVKVLSHTYCIPLTSVIETVRIFKRDIQTIEGREVFNIRDTTIPLIRLNEVFNYNGQGQSDKTFVVITTTGHKEVGLVVDALRGEQEVVIKPLGDYLCSHKGFSGATIMGDGSISLILDVSELVNMITDKVKIQNKRRELYVDMTHCSVQPTVN